MTKRGGQNVHVPSQSDRDMVRLMVAGGLTHEDIARARGISHVTLRKHYRAELDAGAAEINAMVLVEHIKRIRAGDFAAIKWWQQARLGWSEKITVDDPAAANAMRVVVELVGQGAPPAAGRVIEGEARTGPRLPGTVVQLKG